MSLLRRLQSCVSVRAATVNFIAASCVAVVAAFAVGSARGADYIVPGSGEAYFRQREMISNLVFAADGKHVHTYSSRTARVWDVDGKRLVAERSFSQRWSRLGGDEHGIVGFSEPDGFFELDPTTLQPKAGAPSAAVALLRAVRAAHPGEGEGVHAFWRSPGGAACRRGATFCFAPRLDAASWVDVFVGNQPSWYAPGGAVLAYCDDPQRRFNERKPRNLVCERFAAAGGRDVLLKVPYPAEKNLSGLVLSYDGSLLACCWEPASISYGRETPVKRAVEVYRLATQRRLGRIELGADELTTFNFDRAGKQLLVSRGGLATLYDVEERSLAPNVEFRHAYASHRCNVVPAPSFALMAVYDHGHGFEIIDPRKPRTKRLANAADCRPLGLWGDDALVMTSKQGIFCAPLAEGGAPPPELALPPSYRTSLSADRRCLIYASDEGKVTVRTRERTLVDEFPQQGAKVSSLAVSGGGEVWATSHEWDIRIVRRRADGAYAEAYKLDAGAEVRSLMFSADGVWLLAELMTQDHNTRFVVYRETAGQWRPACGPLDYEATGMKATFADAGRLVVTLARLQSGSSNGWREEVRRTADDVVTSDRAVAAVGLVWRQAGAATRLPIVRDGKLSYRDVKTHQETATGTTFEPEVQVHSVYEDLGKAILTLPDGRLAVRTLGK